MRYLSAFTAILVAALIASGCGGGAKSIASVTKCLKGIKGFEVTKAPKTEKGIAEGVFGTHMDLKDPSNMMMAAAAKASTDKDVSKLKKQAKDTEKSSKGKMKVETGVDGRYVWVVAGKKGADYDKAKGCVKP